MFAAEQIKLRPNVPEELHEIAQKELAGYYAHMAALDDCLKDLSDTLNECNIADNTIFVFTSDHGDMLHSHGQKKKQRPWDESIRVPFLLRYPAAHHQQGRTVEIPISTPDIMPTLLGLSGIDIPKTVEGEDWSGIIKGTQTLQDNPVLISCPAPFGQYQRIRDGGKEYRGIRTKRYTYARDLTGPWLLYDNESDPYQLNNLCNEEKYAGLQKKMEALLAAKLEQTNDEFLPAGEYIRNWGLVVDETETVPIYYSGKTYNNS
jgi:arylsulfatase A-like enzyme